MVRERKRYRGNPPFCRYPSISPDFKCIAASLSTFISSVSVCALFYSKHENRTPETETIWLNVAVTAEERPPFTHPEVNGR